LLAYLLIMSPWFYRNMGAIGAPLSPDGLQAFFLRSYDDLFRYGRDLTAQSYLAWGGQAILRSKLEGIAFGLANLLAVNLMIFLAPLALWGMWVWRRKVEVLPALVYLVVLYAAMTVGFTFPGMRGGLFHSSAALLPWLFAAAGAGFDRFIDFMVHYRHWEAARAQNLFTAMLILLAVCLSGFLYWRGVAGFGGGLPWNVRDGIYRQVGEWLRQDAGGNPRVMTNNAPAFYYYTQLPGMSIPNEDLGTVLEAAHRYEAGYLVLEVDHPRSLDALYEGEASHPQLRLALTLRDARGLPVYVYRLEGSER
jgi:hypothetical protein